MSHDEATGGFDVFRRRAIDEHARADSSWRIGFDAKFRAGFERDIVEDIAYKLDLGMPPVPAAGRFLVDIGAGSGELTSAVTAYAASAGLRHVVVDAPEMLAHLDDSPDRLPVAGRFPDCAGEVAAAAPLARVFLAYSVIQYVMRDGLLDDFLAALFRLMTPGSVAVLGDVPNRDTRDRQRGFAPEAAGSGQGSDAPAVARDADVIGVVARARSEGLHGYVLPQPSSLALALHREDILLVRPGPYPPADGAFS